MSGPFAAKASHCTGTQTTWSARYLILTTPSHGEFYRAISLPSRPSGLPPAESIEGTQIKQASQEYGIEFIGPLPDRTD
jgi:hypothetical protein